MADRTDVHSDVRADVRTDIRKDVRKDVRTKGFDGETIGSRPARLEDKVLGDNNY